MSRLRSLLFFLLLLSLPALACNAVMGEPATPTPLPTEPPAIIPTETPVPPAVEPTVEPTPTALPTLTPAATAEPLPEVEVTAAPAVPGRALADDLYVHPQQYFALQPPAGWKLSEDEASASFEAPDGSGFILLQVTDTGYELDADAFATFVENRDRNYFREFADYEVIEVEMDPDSRVGTVSKSLTFEGIPHTVVSVYDQYGPIIYTYDFWTEDGYLDSYSNLYTAILENTEVDPEAAAGMVEYYWVYTFSGPGELFTIEVPTPWEYETSEDPTAIVDTFYAPDGHAVIQNITYDDGEPIGRSEAGTFALELLHEFYADDIRITDDQVQADGSERLTWESPGGGYRGISFVETRGTTFLLFTIMYDDGFEEVYFDTLDYTVSSYAVPE